MGTLLIYLGVWIVFSIFSFFSRVFFFVVGCFELLYALQANSQTAHNSSMLTSSLRVCVCACHLIHARTWLGGRGRPHQLTYVQIEWRAVMVEERWMASWEIWGVPQNKLPVREQLFHFSGVRRSEGAQGQAEIGARAGCAERLVMLVGYKLKQVKREQTQFKAQSPGGAALGPCTAK